ncbi:MAG: DUF512 domain-containing protein [Bacillota bacterium]
MEKDYYLKLIYESVQEYNILPLTSACQQACIFCSHKFNPESIEVYQGGHLNKEMIASLFDYLNPEEPVYIGESATRIIEGEPFLYPDWRQILELFRKKYPFTPLRITTSAAGLEAEDINFLKKLGNIRLTVSINIINAQARKKYLGGQCKIDILPTLVKLAKNNIPIEVSFVAMPGLTGWEELIDSIKTAGRFSNVKVGRIMQPGFSKIASPSLKAGFAVDRRKLTDKIDQLITRISLPLTIEPAIVKSFDASIRGIIPGSPAARAGLQKNDIITSIDGVIPFSRVDAFHLFKSKLLDKSYFQVEFKRNGRDKKSKIKAVNWGKHDYSGLVMDYDFSKKAYQQIQSKIMKQASLNKNLKVLFLTSRLAEDRLSVVSEKIQKDLSVQAKVISVPSTYFGGNIGSAGLMVIKDILKMKSTISKHEPDLVLLPSVIFDSRWRDLTGSSLDQLISELNFPLEIINTN